MAGNGKTNKSRIPNKRQRTTPTPRQETKRKLQPAHVNDVIDISSSAQERFNKPEEMKDNSGVHHLVKEMSAVKSSVEYLMRVVNKLAMTVFQDSPLTSGYRDSTIITPLEERNSYSLPLHTNNSKKHAGGTIIGRKLFDPESDEIIDLYSTHEPVYGINIGLKGGVKIPEWFPVIYRPPENIILNQVEAAVGAYIYADSNYTGLKGSEVLVRTTDKKFSVDRKGLKTLQPMAWVDQDVLNVVVSMLTKQDRCLGDKELPWYLPTIFSQILLMNNGDKEKADLILVQGFPHGKN
ncbi:uncharacterized protein LOC130737778 [Lotus japonicus]|uniref:uncharacterized protein LOC130737778 n=1 Tax=Lotus japonicus TaxID=34305 RepID=UPI00258E7575|nr:uncharacterized protein LOC130737778 [Lotus japonicus]